MSRHEDQLPAAAPPATGDDPTRLLRDLWDRQTDAWFRGERLAAESILEEHPALRSDDRFADLVLNEIDLREALGESPEWEDYRQRFPQFEARLRRRFHGREEAAEAVPPNGDAPPADAPNGRSEDTSVPPPTLKADEPQSTPEQLHHPTLPAPDFAPQPLEPILLDDVQERPAPNTVPGYEVLGELGRGGMGVVYKARQTALNRLVALKMILSGAHAGAEELARFRAEAEAVAKLQHPNIVQVYDVGECEGRPFFSLEFVEGGSLDRKLNRKAHNAREAAALVEKLARAMHSAHEKGIIHRDLKPANILLTPDGTPKITDFGLAKDLAGDAGQTQSGSVFGTPSYMAPEQAAGRVGDIGPPTDVYALGAILYDALTGRPPFKGPSVVDTLAQVRNDEPIPPSRLQPRVPRDLETVCLKCLQKSPRKRYATALDLAEDLRRFLHGEPILARPMGRAERLWRWCRRNPAAASLLLTVTLGSAFGMWHLSQLSESLVRSTALESAAQQSETFDELNNFYSAEVVDRAKPDVTATAAYKSQHGTIPAPATLTIDFGDYLTGHSERGTRVRLYSDLPFRNRTNGGVRDDFEREALERLRENPKEPFYRFEDMDGMPVLRYATARVMKESCVACHNSHPDSPRGGWKVGDVRGVLEITRPLDKDQERTRMGLQGTFLLVGGVAAGLLVLSLLILLVSNRRRRSPPTGAAP